MKYALKDSEGKIAILISANDPVVPEGWTMIGPVSDDLDFSWQESMEEANGEISVNLDKARAQRIEELRPERDRRLLESDAQWVELKSKGQDASAVEALKQTLRDLPQAAADDLSVITDLEVIRNYNPFEVLDA